MLEKVKISSNLGSLSKATESLFCKSTGEKDGPSDNTYAIQHTLCFLKGKCQGGTWFLWTQLMPGLAADIPATCTALAHLTRLQHREMPAQLPWVFQLSWHEFLTSATCFFALLSTLVEHMDDSLQVLLLCSKQSSSSWCTHLLVLNMYFKTHRSLQRVKKNHHNF